MAGLGELFGLKGNSIYDAFAANRNTISGAFLGAAQDPGNPWGGAAQGAQVGRNRDDAYALLEEEKAQQAETLNQTTEWLRNNGHANLLAAVESGAMTPGQAWEIALQPAPEGPRPIEINGQLVDPMTGAVIGDYRDPNSGLPSAPSGYQWNPQTGGLAFIPGGPADPATQANKPPTEGERKSNALTTVTQNDAALLFGDGTANNPGIFDSLGGTWDQTLSAGAFGVNPLAGMASSDYKIAKDAISNIAQSYLYQMSGAAAPVEEVNKIADQVTPKPFDSEPQKAAKRQRLQSMYNAISGNQGSPVGGWEVIGVQ